MTEHKTTKCGSVGIIGKPNVGKSTLTNRFLGQKLCITAKRPQTTRHQIMGIKTRSDAQLIFVDTPGLHLSKDVSRLNDSINRQAANAIHDVDVILWLIGGTLFDDEDAAVLKRLQSVDTPIVIGINKIDLVQDKTQLLPFIESLQEKLPQSHIVPISATKRSGVDELENALVELLPEQDFIFGEDTLTDRSTRFVVEEFIREQCIRQLGQELPYKLTVHIEKFEHTPKLSKIYATIFVEKQGHKKIIIGDGGEKIKAIGQSARMQIQKLIDQKVFLQLWVKVKPNWTDTPSLLKEFGLDS